MKIKLYLTIICLFGSIQAVYSQNSQEITRDGFSKAKTKAIKNEIERLVAETSYPSDSYQMLRSNDVDSLLNRLLFRLPEIEKISLRDSLVTLTLNSDFQPYIYSLYNEIYALLFSNDQIAAASLVLSDGSNYTFLPISFDDAPTPPLENARMKKEWYFYYGDYVDFMGEEELKSGLYYNKDGAFATEKIAPVFKKFKDYQMALEQWNKAQIIAFLQAGAEPMKIFRALNKGLLNYAAENGDWEMYQLLIKTYGAGEYNAYNKKGYGDYYTNNLLIDAIRGNNSDIAKDVIGNKNARPGKEYFSSRWGGNTNNLPTMAVKNGNIEMVRLLLRTGAVIDNYNEKNMTPLMLAAEMGDTEMAEFLISEEANVNLIPQLQNRQHPPLYFAVKSRNSSMIDLLLNHGANINYSSLRVTPLFLAAELGFLDVVQHLAGRGADLNSVCYVYEDESGSYQTPLTIAVTNKHYDVVEYLLQNEVQTDYSNQNDLKPPLAIAAGNGDLKMMEVLMKYINNQDVYSATIADASVAGHIEAIEVLLDNGAQVEDPDSHLLAAAIQGQSRSVAFWLERGAKQDKTDRYFGKTMLMDAIMSGNPECVRLLVEAGADIHARDWHGGTPLMIAAAKGKPEIIEYLLSKGANPNIVDSRGYTLLHYAAEGGGYAAVPLLLNKGMKIEARDKYERTPLMITVEYVCNEMYDAGPSSNAAPTAKVLIEYGANVNAVDFEGMTPLMFAVRGYYSDAVELIVKSGADLTMQNKYGDTAGMFYSPCEYYDNPNEQGSEKLEELLELDLNQLDEETRCTATAQAPSQWSKDQVLLDAIANENHDAIQKALAAGADIFYFEEESPMSRALERGCSVKTLQLLVENGGWIETTTYYGTTPLMRAVSSEDYDAAEYFIKQGADVNRKNDYGNSALIFAAKNGNVPMMKLLVANGADINTTGNCCTPLSMARSENRKEAVEYLESLGAEDYVSEQ